MLRTCLSCCALLPILVLSVGCNQAVDSRDARSATNPRDEAVKEMKIKLDEMDRNLDELKQKVERATGDEKARLETRWQDSAGKREAFAKKLEQLKSAAGNDWEAMKNETEHAFSEFKKAIQ